MRKEIQRHLDILLKEGGRAGDYARTYFDVEQQLLINAEDPRALARKLLCLAGIRRRTLAIRSNELDFNFRPSLTDMVAYLDRRNRPSTYVDPEEAMKASLRHAVIEEANTTFDRLARCLPLTPANVANFFNLLETGVLPCEMHAANDVAVINLDDWIVIEETGERSDLPAANNIIDRLRLCAVVLDRMMAVNRTEALLYRAAMLRNLLVPTDSTVPIDYLGISDALHLTSFDLLWKTLEDWPEFEHLTYLGKVITDAGVERPATPDTVAHFLRRCVLGDCLDVIGSDNASADAVYNAIVLLGRTSPGLASTVEGMAATKRLMETDGAKWHLAMAALHLTNPEQAEAHAAAALDTAKDERTKEMAARCLKTVAGSVRDEAKTRELLEKAEWVLDSDGAMISQTATALLLVLDRHFKWRDGVRTWEKFQWAAEETGNWNNELALSIANACIDDIITLLTSGHSLRRPKSFEGDSRVDFIWTVANLYLDHAGDGKAKRLADAIVSYYRRSGHLDGLALKAAKHLGDAELLAMKEAIIANCRNSDEWSPVAEAVAMDMGDVDAFLKAWGCYARNPRVVKLMSRDLLSRIENLPPRWALRACEVLAGRPHSPEVVEALVQAVDSTLAESPIPEGESAVAYARALLITRAFEGVSAVLLSPVSVSFNDGSEGRLLQDRVALPYVSAMKATFKEDFPDWLKLFGMQLIADQKDNDEKTVCMRELVREFELRMNKKAVNRFKDEAAAAERAKGEAELTARNQVIKDLSHSVKNLVASVVAPLDELVTEIPEKRVVLEKALRGARLIREVINAVNLSSRGSLVDFAKDAEDGETRGGISLAEIVRMSLETACDNMFDTKFFVAFSRNFFPDAQTYDAALKEWRVPRTADTNGLLDCLGRLMFKARIELDRFADVRIGDTRGSRTKFLILLQELLLNAVKYTSFVQEGNRAVTIALSPVQDGMLRLSVTNTCKSGTSVHTTRLGQEIVQNLTRLIHGKLDISEEGGMYSVTVTFPDIFDPRVRARISTEAAKEPNNESAVC